MTPEPTHRLDVDGQVFEVTHDPDRPGQTHLAWLTGPNPGYGFTTASSDGRYADDEQLLAQARDFLGEIDPETGYLD